MSSDEELSLQNRRDVVSSCCMREEADKPMRDVALAAGLQWSSCDPAR